MKIGIFALFTKLRSRISRGNVKTRQKKERFFFEQAYRDLTKKELAVVIKVEKLAVEHRKGIKYDIDDRGYVVKTLIEIPDGLIILKSGNIELYNHEGFAFAIVPDEAYQRVKLVVDQEAKRERRRIENQFNDNYISFVDKLGSSQN